MPQQFAEIKHKSAAPSIELQLSPLALGIAPALLSRLSPQSKALAIRQAARHLNAIADQIDGGVR